MRKRNPGSPQEMERHQHQRDEAVAGPWGDMHEAKRQSGLGRSTIAELIRQQKIRSARVGRRRLVNLPSLLAFIDAVAVGPEAPTRDP
jgi:excisionase family DNA binding protein